MSTSWWVRLCCCCCENNDVRLLLSVSKDSTPARELEGIGEVKVHSSWDGEEVQEVEVSVQEEVKGEETPVVLRHKDEGVTPRTSTADIPSHKAQRESGTFVRSSGSRSSWRLLPTATQQARDAAVAKERTELKEQRKSAILTSSTNLGDGEIVFPDKTSDEERVVILVPEEEALVSSSLLSDDGMTIVGSTTVTVTVSQAEVIDGPSNSSNSQEDQPDKEAVEMD